MEARILKGSQAEFVRSSLADATDPGYQPIGTSVLVLVDEVATTTSGDAGAKLLAEAGMKAADPTAASGIGLDPSMIERMNMASESGVIAGIGEAAFRYYDDGTKWDGRKPGVGDRIVFERYAGRLLLGRDGKNYRMMTHTCIAGMEVALK